MSGLPAALEEGPSQKCQAKPGVINSGGLRLLEKRHRQGEGGFEVDVVDAQLARAAAVAGEPVVVHRHVAQEAVGRRQHGRQGERPGRRAWLRVL